MTKFNLHRDGIKYTIPCNEREMIEENYIEEWKAVEWARGFISSFPNASLHFKFNLLEDKTDSAYNFGTNYAGFGSSKKEKNRKNRKKLVIF